MIQKFCRDQISLNRVHPLGREKDTIITHIPYDSEGPERYWLCSALDSLRDTKSGGQTTGSERGRSRLVTRNNSVITLSLTDVDSGRRRELPIWPQKRCLKLKT